MRSVFCSVLGFGDGPLIMDMTEAMKALNPPSREKPQNLRSAPALAPPTLPRPPKALTRPQRALRAKLGPGGGLSGGRGPNLTICDHLGASPNLCIIVHLARAPLPPILEAFGI